jgi:hypothetical protein
MSTSDNTLIASNIAGGISLGEDAEFVLELKFSAST